MLAATPLLLVNVAAGQWPVSTTPTVPVPMDNVTVFAFSQENPEETDPQVLELAPDINIRGWQRWDTSGTHASDYDAAWPEACETAGVLFMGGTTATALFQDETATEAQFMDWATRDASGNLVLHDNIVTGMYRGSLANPKYRDYLIGIGKIQIDLGVDGLFFDEVNADYEGATYNNDEGFDRYHLADFNAFLLSTLPPGTNLDARYGFAPDFEAPQPRPPERPRASFNYLRYLAGNGWSQTPFAAANPLAPLWGQAVVDHPVPGAADFVGLAEPRIYWKEIVAELRAYAQQRYGRNLLITSNGIWPYVDFQSVGLYDYNNYGPGGVDVDFCPLTGTGDLNGTVSLQSALVNLRNISAQFAPGAPVALFIDWPTPLMNRYNALPASERQDYWRLYAAEAYANGVFFAFHLRTTTGEPTATQAGVMPLFQSLAAFYRAHASLYHGVTPSTANATVSVPGAMIAVSDQTQPNRRLVHIVNHQYNAGFIAQSNVTVVVDAAAAPASVTLASPDLAQDEAVPFSWSGGKLTVTLPGLVAYDIVAVMW
jgi:hypothetical protein